MFKPLRDKILELAITGKLVPQLDSEPAVEQIGPAPAKDEEPFALPEKWKWVKLSSLGEILTGKTPPTTHQEYFGKDIPFITPGDIDDNFHITYDNRGVAFLARNVVKFVPANSVLMVCIGSVGKCGVADREVAFNQQINALVPESGLALSRFLLYAMGAQFFQVQAQRASNRTIISILNKTSWGSLWLPLPPLEEQRRIVAKLDDIMGNLERMDQAYTELSGPMLKHFKNLVLQQAISGQLVPQLDSEPAVEQLGPAPKPEEVPFAIPEKWKWVALENLFQFVDYRGKTPIKSASGVRLITSSNVRKGYLDHTRCEYISIDEYQSRQSRGVSHKGDILFTTEAPLGNVALADLDVFSVGQRVITLKSKGLALNECFVWFLLSNYFQTEILKQATGSTVQGIKAARLKKLVLPLPPIEEQKRIAARINKLFAEADKLLALKELSL